MLLGTLSLQRNDQIQLHGRLRFQNHAIGIQKLPVIREPTSKYIHAAWISHRQADNLELWSWSACQD